MKNILKKAAGFIMLLPAIAVVGFLLSILLRDPILQGVLLVILTLGLVVISAIVGLGILLS